MLRLKTALLPLCILWALFSCQKINLDEDVAPETTSSGNLTINVSQIENTPFLAYTRTELADACTRLNFAVYNTLGTRVKQVNQQVGITGFGSASFQLEEGDYQLVVLAHSSNGNPTMTNPAKIQFTNTQGFTDTFLCFDDTLKIGKDPLKLDLTLNRIVSLCRFIITDDYPADANKIKFYYTGGSGAFDARTGLGCVNSKQEQTFSLASGQKQFDLYTFLHNIEGTIRLKVTSYDRSDNVLRECTFDVPMKQNHITQLPYSYIADEIGKEGVTITINTEWNSTLQVEF